MLKLVHNKIIIVLLNLPIMLFIIGYAIKLMHNG